MQPKLERGSDRMSVYKDEKTNTWKVYYRVTDWKGDKKQSTKRKERDAMMNMEIHMVKILLFITHKEMDMSL